MATKDTILYAVVALLVAGQGYMLYQNHKPQAAPGATPFVGGTSPAAPAIPADIVVGYDPVTQNIFGTITTIGSGSMQIQDREGGLYRVSIAANTKIQLVGKIKSDATQQKELDAYNAQVQELLKDPVKNKAALAAIERPSPNVLTPISASDLHIGDQVFVGASSVTEDGTYVAATIFKSAGVAR